MLHGVVGARLASGREREDFFTMYLNRAEDEREAAQNLL